jgi:hypothetical protein
MTERINLREDDERLNRDNYIAQEAILNPYLPDKIKDKALEVALATIKQVAQHKAEYFAKFGHGRKGWRINIKHGKRSQGGV